MAENPSMGRRLIVGIVAILLVGLLAGVVLAVPWLQAARRQRSVILADGTRVELLGSVIGAGHFTTEQPWQRAVKSMLPYRFRRWLPTPVTSAGIDYGYSNGLTLFLRMTNISTSRLGGSTMPIPVLTFRAVDDDGHGYRGMLTVVQTSGYAFSSTATRPPPEMIAVVTFPAFPRHQKGFELRLTDMADSFLGKLQVVNPVRGPFPQWRPLPVPQSVTNGPVVLTLKRLEDIGTPQWSDVRGVWKVDSTDPVWTNARVKSLRLLDATGNEGAGLSRREPAWKVEAKVCPAEEDADDGAGAAGATTNLTFYFMVNPQDVRPAAR